MLTLEAVDAKIERARSELRLLKADIAAFCEERARLIVREECDEESERWVYRGDAPKAPVQWSIRAGEFAYNLRSALDHLVWQMVEANEGGPGWRNQFPIQNKANPDRFEEQIHGVSQSAKDYIESVQPYQQSGEWYPTATDRVCIGLSLLNELCIMDKHRHLAIANACWTGEWIEVVSLTSFYPMPKLDQRAYLSPENADKVIGCELQNGKALIETSGYRDCQYLKFPVDAFFDRMQNHGIPNQRPLPVSKTLDACMDSAETVVSRLRQEIG